MEIARIFAIARYEFRMYWRQRFSMVLILSLATLPVVFGLYLRSEIENGSGLFAEFNSPGTATYSQSITGTVQWFAWAAIYLILVIMAPLVMSAIIPKDRQLGVRELLDGLPLAPATYLNGKLLAAWGVLLVSLSTAMGITALGWRLTLGTIHMPSVLKLWMIGGGIVIVLNTGLTVLLSAGQPTRRRAYVISAIPIFLTLLFYILANTNLDNANLGEFAWWQFFTPDRSPLTLYFLFQNVGAFLSYLPGVPTIEASRIWQTFLAGLIELFLLWLLAHRYVRTR